MKKRKVGSKEHYDQVIEHMFKLMDKIAEKSPECIDDLKDLNIGLQIINNEYVLKSHPEFISKN